MTSELPDQFVIKSSQVKISMIYHAWQNWWAVEGGFLHSMLRGKCAQHKRVKVCLSSMAEEYVLVTKRILLIEAKVNFYVGMIKQLK